MQFTIDIETIPLPAAERAYGQPTAETVKYGNTKDPDKRKAILTAALDNWESGADCALKAEYGRIAMIGIRINDGNPSTHEISEDTKTGETVLLNYFWNTVQGLNTDDTIVGHNIKSFDIPFILRRSQVLDIRPKAYRALKMDCEQYSGLIVKDTMRIWGAGDRQTYIKLETLAAALGIHVEPSEVTGKDFHKWFAKDREACRVYLAQDVRLAGEIYDRLK